MGVFFGTDGIRGVVNQDLTHEVVFKCGNALGGTGNKLKILIGGDTRSSRNFLTLAFSVGAISAGSEIINVGVCPTAGIAYLTQKFNFDYGVVISASHNPVEYNGVKIFGSNGVKIGDKKEEVLERKFLHEKHNNYNNIGTYIEKFNMVKSYKEHLIKTSNCKLNSLTVLLDGSNGATSKIAPDVFKKLGAKVISTHCSTNREINKNCGSTHPEEMRKMMIKYKADIGFSFDGDGDRVIACDEKGNLIDGDVIIYLISKHLKSKHKLNKNTVVGTQHTNIGVEKALKKEGISLLRTDIGDKYVVAKMEEESLSVGGEQSGHIILREYATTGDGILSAIKLAELVKDSGKKLSELCDVVLYPQVNIDCKVKDKMRIINSAKLNEVIVKNERILGDGYRIMVRVSGTESKIRIMVEGENLGVCKSCGNEIKNIIEEVDLFA